MRWLLICWIALAPAFARAGVFVDATGRSVAVPDDIRRVLPAGPPAAVLLAALAPDLMIGWPNPPRAEAAALLPDPVAHLPVIPRLTGAADSAEAVRALHPDLILDFGDIGERYRRLAAETQARLGVADVLVDGALSNTPQALRDLGRLLHREGRAETLARLAEAILALPPAGHRWRVVSVRGGSSPRLVAPGTGLADVFSALGWQLVAQPGEGPFRPAELSAIASLDPDILVFGSPAARAALAQQPGWSELRAVRDHRVVIAPSEPFGWIDEPPSINRLLGVAWLSGLPTDTVADAAATAAVFNAVVYGRAPTAEQVAAWRHTLDPEGPR